MLNYSTNLFFQALLRNLKANKSDIPFKRIFLMAFWIEQLFFIFVLHNFNFFLHFLFNTPLLFCVFNSVNACISLGSAKLSFKWPFKWPFKCNLYYISIKIYYVSKIKQHKIIVILLSGIVRQIYKINLGIRNLQS